MEYPQFPPNKCPRKSASTTFIRPSHTAGAMFDTKSKYTRNAMHAHQQLQLLLQYAEKRACAYGVTCAKEHARTIQGDGTTRLLDLKAEQCEG